MERHPRRGLAHLDPLCAVVNTPGGPDRSPYGPVVDQPVAAAGPITQPISGHGVGIIGNNATVSINGGQEREASVAEVKAFLRARLVDWNITGWLPAQRRSSELERALRLRQVDPRPHLSGGKAGFLTEHEAWQNQSHLVVIGGPGSGKTWLSRRYARATATQALAQLQAGAEPGNVELPLYTTWSRWLAKDGDLRESLVSAAFDTGLGQDPLSPGVTDRLKQLFTHRDSRVVLVIDSMDEAGTQPLADRWRELRRLSGWRVIVTSRPGAWHVTDSHLGDRPTEQGRIRVVEIQDLTFPADVRAFINAWFSGDRAASGTAGHLARTIENSPELRRNCNIPLILTFYCLLTESFPGRKLPTRPVDLFEELITALLAGQWHGQQLSHLDIASCQEVLREWAWSALGSPVGHARLIEWPGSFQQPKKTNLSPEAWIAVDHIAPIVERSPTGVYHRRFLHRTLMEYLVAQHIGQMEPAKAADVLVPHLWFEDDWRVAASAAVVSSNLGRGGHLLASILRCRLEAGASRSRAIANREIDVLLRDVAASSDPGDWDSDLQDSIEKALTPSNVSISSAALEQVTRSAHWPTTRTMWVDHILNEPDHAWRYSALSYAEALVQYGCAQRARRLGRLRALRSGHQENLVEIIRLLAPTTPERAEARQEVIDIVLQHPANADYGHGKALRDLGIADDERARVLAALRANIHGTGLGSSGPFSAMVGLAQFDAERHRLRSEFLRTQLSLSGRERNGFLWAVLCNSERDQEDSRAQILAAVPGIEPIDLPWIVGKFRELPNRDDSNEFLKHLLLNHAGLADPHGIRHLAECLAMSPLDPNSRRSLRLAMTNRLREDIWLQTERGLLAYWLALDPPAPELVEIKELLIKKLGHISSHNVGSATDALLQMGLTPQERATARSIVLKRIPWANEWDLARAAQALVALGADPAERSEARRAIAKAFPSSYRTNQIGVNALRLLEIEERERGAGIAAINELVGEAVPAITCDYYDALRLLEATDEQLDPVRSALWDCTTVPIYSGLLKKVSERIRALGLRDSEDARLRGIVIDQLLALPRAWRDLLAELQALNPTVEERAHLAESIRGSLKRVDSDQSSKRADRDSADQLVRALRIISPTDQWLRWLADARRPPEASEMPK